jgi:hypothetical protein
MALRATIGLLLRESRLDELLDRLAAAPRAAPRARRPAGARTPVPQAMVSGLRRWPATCLYRALAAYAALREAGEDARFVIGVRREGEDVLAHAWLEHGGQPVDEAVDPRERFTVAYIHPPAPGTSRPEEEDPMAPRRPSPDVVFTRLDDGTGVLLHLGTKFYYALNRSGVVAWEAISRGEPADPETIAEVLAARFAGVDRARARADVEALLRDLEAEGLFAKEL